MDVFVVLQQMLVLFTMMVIGFVAYKIKWIDDHSYAHLSKLCVNVLNPCIAINGVLGKGRPEDGSIILQNLIMMVLYFVILIVFSIPLVKLLRIEKTKENEYRLMTIFSNVGFMGIPVISSIYGQEAIVYVVFYMLGYNLLLYTYGLYLASKGRGEGQKFDAKRLVNAGVIASVVALVIFSLDIKVPASVASFFNYTGNAVVPLSMMLIGASVAQHADKKFFTDLRFYIFAASKMLVIPITAAFVVRMFQLPVLVQGVFILMLAMPVGSIVVMVAKETGMDERTCTIGSVLTTLLSILTIPIVAIFLPF